MASSYSFNINNLDSLNCLQNIYLQIQIKYSASRERVKVWHIAPQIWTKNWISWIKNCCQYLKAIISSYMCSELSSRPITGILDCLEWNLCQDWDIDRIHICIHKNKQKKMKNITILIFLTYTVSSFFQKQVCNIFSLACRATFEVIHTALPIGCSILEWRVFNDLIISRVQLIIMSIRRLDSPKLDQSSRCKWWIVNQL